MNRKNAAIETEYRPHPFWSWNDRLEPQETARQVRLMGDAGIGGFFMHARGGLQTAYMSEEWHANIRAAIDAAKEYGMHPWIYDEDGWPSGFGGGIVSGMGSIISRNTCGLKRATAGVRQRSAMRAGIIYTMK